MRLASPLGLKSKLRGSLAEAVGGLGFSGLEGGLLREGDFRFALISQSLVDEALQGPGIPFGAEVDKEAERRGVSWRRFFHKFDVIAAHHLMDTPTFTSSFKTHFEMSHFVLITIKGISDLAGEFQKPFAGIIIQRNFTFEIDPAEEGFSVGVSFIVDAH